MNPVDGEKLFLGQAVGQGHQGIQLHQGLPPLVIRPQRHLPVPLAGQVVPGLEARVGFDKAVSIERRIIEFFPQLFVVDGQTVEAQCPGDDHAADFGGGGKPELFHQTVKVVLSGGFDEKIGHDQKGDA